jgi:hypothetical protein
MAYGSGDVGGVAAIPYAQPTVDLLQQGGGAFPADPNYGAGGSGKARSWLDYRPSEYRALAPKWTYSRDHYTGEVLDPEKVAHYLVRKAMGEGEETWKERLRLADYANHYASVVDTMVGMLSGIEGDASREWTDEKKRGGLGDPDDPDSWAATLLKDTDGMGSGWIATFMALATELCVTHWAWVAVDGEGGVARVRVIPPESVVNWRWDRVKARDGTPARVLAEALVCESVDLRRSMEDEPRTERRYVQYTLGGWQRWRQDDNGNAIKLGDIDAGDLGTYEYTDRQGRSQLPIFPIKLPMRRMVGYLMAKKCNAIFNRESDRDALLRLANHPKLNYVGSRDEYALGTEDLRKGANVLHQLPANPPHNYIAPPTESAAVATEVLKQKVADFYRTAAKEYDDATPMTATEVRQRVAASEGAFLEHLRAALDTAENGAMWRVEQYLYPTDRAKHFVAKVQRSSDFLPLDPDAVIDKQAARVFGPNVAVPVGHAAATAAAKETAEHQGLPANEAQVAAGVQVQMILDAMTKMPDLPLPAGARALVAVSLMEAAGMVAPATATPAALAAPALDRTAMLAAATALAEASDEAKRREAESFPGTQPPNDNPDNPIAEE